MLVLTQTVTTSALSAFIPRLSVGQFLTAASLINNGCSSLLPMFLFLCTPLLPTAVLEERRPPGPTHSAARTEHVCMWQGETWRQWTEGVGTRLRQTNVNADANMNADMLNTNRGHLITSSSDLKAMGQPSGREAYDCLTCVCAPQLCWALQKYD